MSFDRTTLLSGPAKIVVTNGGAKTFFAEGNILVRKIVETFDVPTDAFGVVARPVRTKRLEIDFIPKMWSDLTILFPYASKQIGDRIFGASDIPMLITPRNGDPLTIANVAVMQMASIMPSATKGLLGAMKWVGLCANNADPKLDASYFSYAGAPASDVALTGFDLTKVPNCKYVAGWNSASYQYKEGTAEINFDLGLEPEIPDGESIVNYLITSLEAKAKFNPIGLTESAYKALLGDNNVKIGAPQTLSDLVFTGQVTGAPVVTIANCLCEAAQVQYGKTDPRTGEVGFQSVRAIASNLLSPLWTFGVAA